MDFSAKSLQAMREWNDTFKMLKEKHHQPGTVYPAKLSFRNSGELDFPRQTKAVGIQNQYDENIQHTGKGKNTVKFRIF